MMYGSMTYVLNNQFIYMPWLIVLKVICSEHESVIVLNVFINHYPGGYSLENRMPGAHCIENINMYKWIYWLISQSK